MSHTVHDCTEKGDIFYGQLREEKYERSEIAQIGLTLIMFAIGETTAYATMGKMGFGTPESAEA
jgi:hypothetical protein